MAAYASKTETGGRGGLHAHDLLSQRAMQPSSLMRLLDNAKDAVFSFVERLMCGFLPASWRLGHQGARKVAIPPPGVDVSVMPPYVTAAACRPPLDGSLPTLEEDASRARRIADCQMHQHTARCRKGGHAGA